LDFAAQTNIKGETMSSAVQRRFTAIALVALLAIPFQLGGQENQGAKEDSSKSGFAITSMTMKNGETLPNSMIYNVSGCAPNGGSGMDQSPDVSWTGASPNTKTLVVILYDITAAITHWGMYNIPPDPPGLLENAGVVGSTAGQEVANDFTFEQRYDGPCPPTNAIPQTHEYVLTVYTLDEEIKLPEGSKDFPPFGETLFRTLVEAGKTGHILQSASITGHYSAVTPKE
jgi:Raf kinase inhibitor-like YbhB/YbcL family protein